LQDASSVVRVSSNSLLSFFLQNLKKEASSTGLRQSLPFLLFSLHDPSNQVVESANTLIEQCFTGEKRQRLEANFGEASTTIAIEIICKKHKLVQDQK